MIYLLFCFLILLVRIRDHSVFVFCAANSLVAGFQNDGFVFCDFRHGFITQ